jgi:hypothetical protein
MMLSTQRGVSQIAERQLAREFAKIPSMYSKYLSQSLKERLLSLAERPDHERLSLDAEIDLTRESVLSEIRLYDLACQNHEKALNTELEPECLLYKIQAAERMRAGLDTVASLCERVVRMRAAGKESLPVHAVNMLIMQVTKIAHETMPEEFVPQFVQRLAGEVRISDEHSVRGTHLTPDQDARDMDATIPMYTHRPEENQETA